LGIPGDYSANGTVDAADYVLWRDNLNASVTLPNDSTPGTVAQADYDVWRANFGRSSAASAGATLESLPAPEPESLMLCVIVLSLVAAVRGTPTR
jgi:hypothetical protein